MKKNKIIYWSLTALVSLGFLISSFMYLSGNPELLNGFKQLGFPPFFIPILGLAKLLGGLAIINPWWPKLREWAYAGFTFTLIGAVWVHVATGTPFISPLVFFILLATSYYYNRKIQIPVSSVVVT